MEVIGRPEPLIRTPATHPRTVALTFDDGPGPWTPPVLGVLGRRRVRATFFVTGTHVAAHPTLVRAVVRAGHRLGNHSWSHPQDIAGSVPRGSFDRLPPAVQAEQIDATQQIVADLTGVRPVFFRGPAGHHFAAATLALAAGRGLSVAHWTVSTEDWRQPAHASPAAQAEMVAAVTSGAGDHPIVLCHDGKASAEPEEEISSYRGNTVACLDAVIDFFQAAGHVFTDPAGVGFG